MSQGAKPLCLPPALGDLFKSLLSAPFGIATSGSSHVCFYHTHFAFLCDSSCHANPLSPHPLHPRPLNPQHPNPHPLNPHPHLVVLIP